MIGFSQFCSILGDCSLRRQDVKERSDSSLHKFHDVIYGGVSSLHSHEAWDDSNCFHNLPGSPTVARIESSFLGRIMNLQSVRMYGYQPRRNSLVDCEGDWISLCILYSSSPNYRVMRVEVDIAADEEEWDDVEQNFAGCCYRDQFSVLVYLSVLFGNPFLLKTDLWT